MDVVSVDGDQLGVRSVAVLADDVLAVVEAGVEDDLLTDVQAVDALAESLDDAGPVSPEDAWLRRRGHPHPCPDVEVVQRRSAEPDQHLARPRDGVREHPRSAGPPGLRPRG